MLDFQIRTKTEITRKYSTNYTKIESVLKEEDSKGIGTSSYECLPAKNFKSTRNVPHTGLKLVT